MSLPGWRLSHGFTIASHLILLLGVLREKWRWNGGRNWWWRRRWSGRRGQLLLIDVIVTHRLVHELGIAGWWWRRWHHRLVQVDAAWRTGWRWARVFLSRRRSYYYWRLSGDNRSDNVVVVAWWLSGQCWLGGRGRRWNRCCWAGQFVGLAQVVGWLWEKHIFLDSFYCLYSYKKYTQ